MVTMEEAEKIAREFIKKKTNPIRPVSIVMVNPINGQKTWRVGGNYVIELDSGQNWVFDFSLDIDENGKIASYNLNV